MRVMVIVKASKESEAGVMPGEKLLADMAKFNEQLVKAGVMLAGDGLHPTSRGKRVRFSGGERTVIDGPFDGGEELEVRPVFEAEDFGKEFTPELRAQEERLRAEVERQQKA